MKKALLTCVPVLLIAGLSNDTKVTIPKSESPSHRMIVQAAGPFRAGDINAAERFYNQALDLANRASNNAERASALFGLANCRYSRMDPGAGLMLYAQARSLAISANDSTLAGLISIAMSDAYRRFGNPTQSREMLSQAIRLLPQDDPQYPYALLSLGTMETYKKAYSSAYFHLKTALFHPLLAGGSGTVDNRLEISALERLGLLFRQQDLLDDSESYLSNAYRLASLQKSPLLSSVFLSLARLRLAQHRPREAVVFLKRSVELGRKTPLFLPTYFAIYYQGLALQEMGDLQGALAAFQSALTLATAWRLGTSPSDSQRTGSDIILLQRIYDGYIDAGMELYKKSHDPALSARMYSLVEEGRALSLREQLQSSRQMPVEYWRVLADLRRAEIALYRNESPEATKTAAGLRLKLNELETAAGLGPYPSPIRVNSPVLVRNGTLGQSHSIQTERFSSEQSLYPFKPRVKEGEALFSFYLGSKGSYLWVSTSRSVEVHLLPPRQEIERWIRDFRSAVENSAPNQLELGERLYADLFAGVSKYAAGQPAWILSLDDALFDLPFAALRVRFVKRESRYLAEEHSLRIVPGARMLNDSSPKPGRGGFAGIGDPVYNTADSRWGESNRNLPILSWLPFTQIAHAAGSDLARLPASGREVQACSHSWNSAGQPAILLGRQVQRTSLEKLLASRPSVLHLATHVVQPLGQKDQAMLAIGLDATGQPDFLTPTEIGGHMYRPGLVVMTGCSSGQGSAQPGAGLLGLTRSWILSGAQSVVASHWPTLDNTGVLFQEFYSAYPSKETEISSSAVAAALQQAQIKMLHSAGWRAQPRHWAAFYVMGKD